MLADRSLRPEPPPEPCVLLWRYMIHKLTFTTFRMPGPLSPRAFCESLGFVATGEKDEDEDILVLDLPQPMARAR